MTAILRKLVNGAMFWVAQKWLYTLSVTDHLVLAHAVEDPEPYLIVLADSVALLRRTDAEKASLVDEHVRMVVLTASADKLMRPNGVVFLPIASRKWRSPRALAGHLVWAAEFFRADHVGELRRSTQDQVRRRAEAVRNEFLQDASLFEN